MITGFTFLLSGILPESGFSIFAGLTLAGGISMALYSASFMVVIQTHVDMAVMGRVFSLYGSLTLLPSIFGLLQTGYIADAIGVPNAFIISGSAIILIAVWAFFVPALRSMAARKLI